MVAALGPAEGSAQPAEPAPDYAELLDRAQNAWAFGDFGDVVTMLAPAVLPPPPDAPSRATDRALAQLGASAIYVDNPELAEEAFVELLRRDAEAELDPFLFPNSVLDFFELVRQEHRSELGVSEPADVAAGETVWVERRIVEQPLAVSMLPFGVGFFAGDRRDIGATWASLEAGLLATSVSFWFVNESSRVDGGTLVGPQGGLPRTDVTVRRQRAQVATGALFLAAVVGNAIHGAIWHDNTRRVDVERLDGPPPEFFGTQANRSDRGFRIRFVPILEP